MSYLISQNGWYLIGVKKGDTLQNTLSSQVNLSVYNFTVTNAYCVNNNYFGSSSPSPGNFTVTEWKDLKNEIKNFDIIINATSLGLKNNEDFNFNFEPTKKNLIFIIK